MANNRELSQFGSFISVNDINKKITIGSTITKVLTDELKVNGISTVGFLTATDINVSGIITASTFKGNFVGVASLTDLNVTGITTVGVLTGTDAYFTGIVTATKFVVLTAVGVDEINTNRLTVTGISSLGITTASSLEVTGITTLGTVKISSGIITSSNPGITTVFYYGDGSGLINVYSATTGISSEATKLETPRDFKITGDIVSTIVSFDGTSNVSLASTISDNAVGLGTKTYGDYVKNITGTANEIEVSVTSGAQVSPQIGLPNDVTISQDLQINRNLNVTGNITVGGTSAYLNVVSLQVKDRDIVLGITTNGSGIDVSTDITANHGGIAIASTEGNPLISLRIAGINSLPDTYKQIMWLKKGTFAGLNTDAWLSNYAIGIGSTQIANGVRLAVGTGITMSDDNITAGYYYGDGSNLTNIKASSISGNITGAAGSVTVFSDSTNLTRYISFVEGTSGVSSVRANSSLAFNPSTTRLGIGTANPTSTLQVQGDLKVTGVSTLGSVKIYSSGNNGIVTATSVGATVFYYGDGSGLINIPSTAVSGGSTVSISTNTNNQTQYLTYVTGTGSTTGFGVSTTGLVFNPSTGNVGIGTINPKSTLQVGTAITMYGSTGIVSATYFYGDGSNLKNIPSTAVSGGSTVSISTNTNNQTQYLTYVTGTGSTTGFGVSTTGLVFNPSSSTLGIGTTSPTATLHVQGDVRITGALYASNVNGINTSGKSGQVLQSVGTGISWVDLSTSNVGGGSTITISSNNTNQIQYLTYVTGTGSTTGFGVSTTSLVFNPFSGNLGIGTTNPKSSLQVGTAITMYGSTGIVSAAYFYGDGSNLKNIKASSISGGSSITISSNTNDIVQYLTFATGAGSTTELGIATSIVFNPSGIGSIGIGITQPKGTVDIGSGDIRLNSGDLRLNGTIYIYDTRNSGGGCWWSNGGLDSIFNINNTSLGGPIGLTVRMPGGTPASFEDKGTGDQYTFLSGRYDQTTTQGVTNISGLLGIGTANPTSTLQVQGDLKVTGVSTLGSVKIYSSGNNGIVTSSNPGVSTVFYYGDGSNLTNIKTSAISGDIGLGTNTYGDYVKNITGTANEIEVSVTSGEQVSPQIGLPNDVTIGNDLTVSQNLYVSGNITVGGTTAALDVTNLQVKDKNIILGVTTSPSTGADASTDFSASQGGIAIASTEGTPLVKLGITSIPNTYKQILWFKSNSLTGLSTDAWIFNYGVGIGSTQIANGVRLAVGTGITMSDGSITAGYFYGDGSGLTKIKASSISGASTITISANNSDQTQYLTFATGVGTVTGLNIDNNIGLVYNPSSERLGIGTTNPTSTLQVQGDLKVTGVSTLGSVKIYSSGNNGIVTATSVGATVFYYGDGSGLINIPSTAVSGGSSISISSNTNNQTQYLTFANGTGSTTGLGITTSGLVFNPSSTRLGIGTTNSTATLHVEGGAIVTGVSTLGSVKIYSSGNIGIITSTTPGVTTVTYYGDGSKLSGITAAASAGGTTGQVQFNNNGVISGASYFNYDSTNVRVGIGTSVPTARLSVSSPTSGNSLLLVNDNLSDGSLFRVSNSAGSLLVDVDSGGTILFPTSGNVGIGTTLSTPTTKLQVQGDITANYYYGDGSTLKNLGLGGIGITNTNLSTIVYPTLAANTTSGIATVGIATTALSFNTSTNTILIGSGITMYGSTGIISATRYYGDGSYLKLPTFSIAGTTGQVLYNNNGQIDAAANLNYNTTTGNVGIGTTLATARLSVSNPTSGSSLLLVNDNLSDGSLFRVSNSVGSLLVDVDSGGTILFPTTGNVGIGTTLVSPTSKLQVDGDVRVGVNTSQGIILTSPNGTKYRLFVSNVGIVSTVLVS